MGDVKTEVDKLTIIFDINFQSNPSTFTHAKVDVTLTSLTPMPILTSTSPHDKFQKPPLEVQKKFCRLRISFSFFFFFKFELYFFDTRGLERESLMSKCYISL
ncbi:hypothetical protein RHMOL_Rhmol04G0207700 [Rhododendron molle]|uniref:Uncharacterized protein n=1 Tax=Rhododendron molle TaxID=49168 RepID=A0ACC0P494_RHOML|nr:hypothetical protein RHMOL_Rhmol04G0207700 [Rhododendron molle]